MTVKRAAVLLAPQKHPQEVLPHQVPNPTARRGRASSEEEGQMTRCSTRALQAPHTSQVNTQKDLQRLRRGRKMHSQRTGACHDGTNHNVFAAPQTSALTPRWMMRVQVQRGHQRKHFVMLRDVTCCASKPCV